MKDTLILTNLSPRDSNNMGTVNNHTFSISAVKILFTGMSSYITYVSVCLDPHLNEG